MKPRKATAKTRLICALNKARTVWAIKAHLKAQGVTIAAMQSEIEQLKNAREADEKQAQKKLKKNLKLALTTQNKAS